MKCLNYLALYFVLIHVFTLYFLIGVSTTLVEFDKKYS